MPRKQHFRGSFDSRKRVTISPFFAVSQTFDLSIMIAFMDIDKFKDFNTEMGETNVDLHVLPRFMATLEAQVYARGHAYRYGGDEYAVLLPNADTETGICILKEFQQKLVGLKYRGIERKTTVSIGVCEAQSDTHFTSAELLQRAEKAKNYAKENNRDCIATYGDPDLDSMYVLRKGSVL
jgi:diguanylate cyclase (GGDEF)-like protein